MEPTYPLLGKNIDELVIEVKEHYLLEEELLKEQKTLKDALNVIRDKLDKVRAVKRFNNCNEQNKQLLRVYYKYEYEIHRKYGGKCIEICEDPDGIYESNGVKYTVIVEPELGEGRFVLYVDYTEDCWL